MPQLADLIRNELAEQGAMPFARFMELALYCPELGFYEKEADNVGRRGDFFTSVSVGPLFGELLAFQFAQWLAAVGGGKLRLVEAGAHDGRLAGDILGWLKQHQPEVFARCEYWILEPSERRQQWQQARLAEFGKQVQWRADFAGMEATSGDSCFTVILSNELLDAMPVRRFGWDAKARTWFEWGVAGEGEKFLWRRLAVNRGSPASLSAGSHSRSGMGVSPVQTGTHGRDARATMLPSSPDLLAVLPDGYTIEVSPAAESWWSAAARWLTGGKLLAFDYGFGAEDELQPARLNGTLRAYRRHQLADDVLADPGEQDLTAHVNFARIAAAGQAAGLKTDVFESQGRYLTGIAAETWKPESGFGDWNSKRTRQFQTLTHPEHLGNKFRVLVQSRG